MTPLAAPAPEHHTVIVVGGGPAGLPLAAVLAGGWWPFYRPSAALRARAPELHARLAARSGTLLALDFRAMAAVPTEARMGGGTRPVDFFNLLHRPTPRFLGPDGEPAAALEFGRGEPVDCLLLSREPAGGLWNGVPRRLLTLSPGHWMELALYPLARWAAETGRHLDPEALIAKEDLVAYYHAVPERCGISDRLRTDTDVCRVEPHERGFLLTAVTPRGEQRFTCRCLVWAVGQRCVLRRLGVPGEDLPLVCRDYDCPESLPGDHVLVVGGGRSADWAATELHDAGRRVTYVMRQPRENHWRLIRESLHLPYYARLAEVLHSPRLDAWYGTHVTAIEPDGAVRLRSQNGESEVQVDRVVVEIGAEADYSPFTGFPPLTLVEKRDRYRFQCWQMVTHPHSYESVDIPGLYPGGYLAAGINNVVVAMHGTTYAIAADILQREGVLAPGG